VTLTFEGKPALTKVLVKHGVTLVLEFEDAVEDFSVVPEATRRGDTEIYDFGAGHRLEVRYMAFFVNGSRYPASEAVLFSFLPQTGPWTFTFRGQRFVVEKAGAWRPSLYYRVTEVESKMREEKLAATRLPRHMARAGGDVAVKQSLKSVDHEEIQVSGHTIIFHPDAPWTIDGHTISQGVGTNIFLEVDGTVRQVR